MGAALVAEQQASRTASSCARRSALFRIFTSPRYVFWPCPAEIPFEMIVLRVFLPIWIILVPVSACW